MVPIVKLMISELISPEDIDFEIEDRYECHVVQRGQLFSFQTHPRHQLREIALPDIQRPFVWNNAKVRDLFDSMYKGFPVGYLLFWENGVHGWG
jgi:uncharacterized protein with ParB-like and HNH nuclease domain